MVANSKIILPYEPGYVGNKDFARSITRGFAAVGETGVAVCPRPGTELAFEDQVQYDRALSLSGKARVNHKVARFRQINMDHPHAHHDALEFPGGQIAFARHRHLTWWLSAPRSSSSHGRPQRGAESLFRHRRGPPRVTFKN